MNQIVVLQTQLTRLSATEATWKVQQEFDVLEPKKRIEDHLTILFGSLYKID